MCQNDIFYATAAVDALRAYLVRVFKYSFFFSFFFTIHKMVGPTLEFIILLIFSKYNF